MRILIAASEMAPYAKTGGLADVVGSLSRALADAGHEVICVMPYYRSVAESESEVRALDLTLTVPVGVKQVTADILETSLDAKVRVFFVRRDEYFDRSQLYRIPERDYEDNAERFIFFSKIVVSLVDRLQLRPDVIHCHDWQTALVPVFLRWASGTQTEGKRESAAANPALIFTIHNLAYQGIFWAFDFPMTNLPWEYFTADKLEFFGHLNCMKGGMIYSDAVTTVSRRYAEEIQTGEYGFGLEDILQKRNDHLHGILNGADYSDWNPATDRFIKQKFSPDDMQGKRACKQDLLQTFGLADEPEAPLMGIVSRLTDQKGFDLLASAIQSLVNRGVKLVVLGEGESNCEQMFRGFAEQFPKQVAVRISFDNALAHKIEAGSDCFLMPSRFEPCGLNQMYSLKYGTIPIVRATGGLDDTLEDFNLSTGKGNGFKFQTYSAAALVKKVDAALAVFAKSKQWKQLQKNAMACDFSWRVAAKKYEELYRSTRAGTKQ